VYTDVLPVETPPRPVRAPRWETPALLRLFAAAVAVLVTATALLIAWETGRERAALRTIGGSAGPEVVATSDLYFALNDMDAQLANVLLVGASTGLGLTRAQALDIFEQRRQQADRDLRQAAASAADPATQQTVGDLLDTLGRYEALAAQVVLLNGQTTRPAGRPAPAALDDYRQATDLLRSRLLPDAATLTDQHARALEARYEGDHGRILAVRVLVLLLGVLALAVLIVMQVWLARRFRRLVSPALAAATCAALAGLLFATALLGGEAGHLRVAKKDAFDSVLALTRARAVSYDANADESRYLVDPARAAAYQQAFLDKSQQLLTLPGAYDPDHYDHSATGWGGFFGTEFRNITFAGERAAAEATLQRYQLYQLDDRHIRVLAAAGRLDDAIAFCTGYAPGDSNYAFTRYDEALAGLIAINTRAFAQAAADGQHDLAVWKWALWPVWLAILVLVAVAVRPRLAEYRR
jgi:hypothetical protein